MQAILIRIRSLPGKEIGAVALLLFFWAYLCIRVLTHFFTHFYISGAEIDMIGQVWMSWWAHKAFTTPGLSPFFCPFLNYPLGIEAFTYHVAFVHVMISGLLRPVLGMVGSINAMFVYGLLLSILGIYTLLRQITSKWWLAALFTTLPIFHAKGQVGFIDIEQVNFGYLAFALASWLALCRRGGKNLTVLTGILIGLTCITQMYYGIFLFMTLGMALIAARAGLLPTKQPFRSIFFQTSAATALGILIGIIPLIPSALTISKIGIYEPIPIFINSPSPLSGFLHPAHLLPIPILGVLIWFVARKERQVWFWFFTVSIFLLLAAGPYMDFGDKSIPMPFWLLRQIIPLFWRLSMPVRFGRMAIILLALVMVLLHSSLKSRFAENKSAAVFSAIFLFFTANFFAPMMQGNSPFNMSAYAPIPIEAPQKAPEFFRQLGMEKQNQAAFTLRCEIDAQLSAYYQVFHQMPISGMPLVAGNLRGHLPQSELTRFQNQFCLAIDDNMPLPALPAKSWWRQKNVRYLFLASSFLEAAPGSFKADWEKMYGKPVASYKYVHIYDLLN